METSHEPAGPGRLPLETPTQLSVDAARELSEQLTALLADTLTLYLKTKNFHWHMSGSNFRDYHTLLDDQSDELLGSVDPIAERVRKIGGTTLKSAGQLARIRRLSDNDADFVPPLAMLRELQDDNAKLAAFMRQTHERCDRLGDVASASLLENWIDQAEGRIWFLFEAGRV
jgi:starvation-inducible DNA-binding protein